MAESTVFRKSALGFTPAEEETVEGITDFLLLDDEDTTGPEMPPPPDPLRR